MTKVHYNLRTHLWSVTERGLVVDTVTETSLCNVTFYVSQAGHKRAMEKLHKRTVHAWAHGEQCALPATNFVPPSEAIEVCYNPYRGSTFTLRDGTPVYSARVAYFCTDKRCYILP